MGEKQCLNSWLQHVKVKDLKKEKNTKCNTGVAVNYRAYTKIIFVMIAQLSFDLKWKYRHVYR